jgi:hypothetical protein
MFYSEYAEMHGEHRSFRSRPIQGQLILSSRCDVLLTLNRKFGFLLNLHPAERFPFMISIVIILQEIYFIGVQASALRTVRVTACGGIVSTLLYPCELYYTNHFQAHFLTFGLALFVLGYVHIVWGVELTVKSLRGVPFSNSYRYSNRVNLAFLSALYFPTVLTARFASAKRKTCLGNLIFRASDLRLNTLAVVLIAIIMVSVLVMAAIITRQLLRTVHIDPTERIMATRMVYYLVATGLIYVSQARLVFGPDADDIRRLSSPSSSKSKRKP